MNKRSKISLRRCSRRDSQELIASKLNPCRMVLRMEPKFCVTKVSDRKQNAMQATGFEPARTLRSVRLKRIALDHSATLATAFYVVGTLVFKAAY